MDVMESLRLTQKQLDRMAKDIAHLTIIVQKILCATKQATSTSDQTYSQVYNARNTTEESVQKAQMGNGPLPSDQGHSDENKTEWTSPIQVNSVAETIVIGGINVSRLRDAHKDQTNLKRNVKFVSAINKNTWDLIPGCIRKVRRSKLNVVLHNYRCGSGAEAYSGLCAGMYCKPDRSSETAAQDEKGFCMLS